MARKTVYCVQPYVGAGGRLTPGRMIQFGNEGEARAAGGELRDRKAGVLVFAISGEPDFDLWDEPRVLAEYGETPKRAF